MVHARVFHGTHALDLPTVPLALVVGLGLCGQTVDLAVHGRRVRTVLAHELDRHHHAVPLAALFELSRLHGDESSLRHTIGVHDHHVVVGRVLDVVAVVKVVLVVTGLAVGARQDVAGGGVDRNRRAAACSTRGPFDVLADVGAWDNHDAFLAVIQLACYGVEHHTGHGAIHLTDLGGGAGQQTQKRQGKVVLRHALKATAGVLFKVRCEGDLVLLSGCNFVLAHDTSFLVNGLRRLDGCLGADVNAEHFHRQF